MNILETTATGIEEVAQQWRIKLLGVDETIAHQKPSADRWSISEVIGHLVDSACNNHQRFVRAQHCDVLTFPKYEQNQWTESAAYRESDWNSLVQLWYYYNLQIAILIRNIPESQLETRCTITPYEPCTLEFLVTDYLAHLHHHLNILEKRISGEAME